MGIIRKTVSADFPDIYAIINDAAVAYKGVIPSDRWHVPYMPEDELRDQIQDGVVFWCYAEGSDILGVMGIQDKGAVSLIRHAYVRTVARQKGIGGKLLTHLCSLAGKPVLIGTWAAASWAISFYEKYGFHTVSEQDKAVLLRRYWTIPDRQIETSVVLTRD